MKEIIFEGNPKSNSQHIFKCRYCNTIFKTDEYEYYKYGAFGNPMYITICPVCNKEKAYTETDLKDSDICDEKANEHSGDQPVKYGEWIFQNRNDEDGRHIYHCSECDLEVKVFPYNFLSWRMHEKYCPGCGARMDGVVE